MKYNGSASTFFHKVIFYLLEVVISPEYELTERILSFTPSVQREILEYLLEKRHLINKDDLHDVYERLYKEISDNYLRMVLSVLSGQNNPVKNDFPEMEGFGRVQDIPDRFFSFGEIREESVSPVRVLSNDTLLTQARSEPPKLKRKRNFEEEEEEEEEKKPETSSKPKKKRRKLNTDDNRVYSKDVSVVEDGLKSTGNIEPLFKFLKRSQSGAKVKTLLKMMKNLSEVPDDVLVKILRRVLKEEKQFLEIIVQHLLFEKVATMKRIISRKMLKVIHKVCKKGHSETFIRSIMVPLFVRAEGLQKTHFDLFKKTLPVIQPPYLLMDVFLSSVALHQSFTWNSEFETSFMLRIIELEIMASEEVVGGLVKMMERHVRKWRKNRTFLKLVRKLIEQFPEQCRVEKNRSGLERVLEMIEISAKNNVIKLLLK